MFEGEYLNNNKLIGKQNGKYGHIYKLNNTKGEGEDYDNIDSNIIFRGEFLNGEKNGKGKEYHYIDGKLKFEGEYKNNKRNGKGKEYDNDDNIMFEGEYLNDKRWEGKGYNKWNKCIYELKKGKGIIKEYDYYGK